MRPLVALLALLGIVATALLGNWQRHKAAHRLELQERIEAALKDAPIALGDRVADVASLEWRRVKAQGVWQPQDVIYLDNRPSQGRVGFYVLMPLRLTSGEMLIVNRGWLPRDPAQRDHIAPYETPAGAVEVVGVLHANEDRFLELARAPAPKTGTIWENFDFDAFAKASGSIALPCIVRQDAAAADGLDRSWPDRGSAFERQIERNRGYAFQWYAMCAAIVALSLFYGFRNARHTRTIQS